MYMNKKLLTTEGKAGLSQFDLENQLYQSQGYYRNQKNQVSSLYPISLLRLRKPET